MLARKANGEAKHKGEYEERVSDQEAYAKFKIAEQHIVHSYRKDSTGFVLAAFLRMDATVMNIMLSNIVIAIT